MSTWKHVAFASGYLFKLSDCVETILWELNNRTAAGMDKKRPRWSTAKADESARTWDSSRVQTAHQ